VCEEQKALFKASVDRLPYVECFPNGRNGTRAPACVERQITSYPTWHIGGQWYIQLLTPERLAQLSGYQGPAQEKEPPGRH
jgi:hypothetical protein